MELSDSQLQAAVRGIAGIAALLVFGSQARGTARPDSDLDVAVLPVTRGVEDRVGFRHRLQKAIAVALADFALDGRVDVVFLDDAPVTLRQRVMEHGRMIVCDDLPAWQELRVWTMKEYGDTEWMRDLYRRELRRRLIEGRPSGRSARAAATLERARKLSG